MELPAFIHPTGHPNTADNDATTNPITDYTNKDNTTTDTTTTKAASSSLLLPPFQQTGTALEDRALVQSPFSSNNNNKSTTNSNSNSNTTTNNTPTTTKNYDNDNVTTATTNSIDNKDNDDDKNHNNSKKRKISADVDDDGKEDDLMNDSEEEQFHEEDIKMNEGMKLFLASLSDEQRDRYEVVRRSRLHPNDMKKFLRDIGYQPPSKECRIILGSIAKVFAGELVEEARDIMLSMKHEGPLKPKHMRMAARKMKKAGQIPSLEYTQSRLFQR